MPVEAIPSVTPSASTPVAVLGFTSGLATVGVRVMQGTTTITARTTTGVSESPAGSGRYVKTLTAPSSVGVYELVWDDGQTTPTYASEGLLVATIAYLDPLSGDLGTYADGTAGADLETLIGSLDAMVTSPPTIYVVSPVAEDGSVLELVAGDDYLDADDQAVPASFTEAPDLTGGSIDLAIKGKGLDDPIVFPGDLGTTGPTGTQTATFDIAGTDTEPLTPSGSYVYDIQATLASGSKRTLIKNGRVDLIPSVAP